MARPEEHAGHSLVAGVDWGKQNDFTAISVGCAGCRQEVVVDRFNQIDYSIQRGRLKAIYERWRPGLILAESNSMGAPIIEQLQAEGLPVRGFATTASTKQPLIEALALCVERGIMQWLPNPVWRAELEAYSRIISQVTGRSVFSAPQGMSDDTVIARALMWMAAKDSDAGGLAAIYGLSCCSHCQMVQAIPLGETKPCIKCGAPVKAPDPVKAEENPWADLYVR